MQLVPTTRLQQVSVSRMEIQNEKEKKRKDQENLWLQDTPIQHL
jgi:hypothetical protein